MSTAGIFNTSNFGPSQINPSFSSQVYTTMPNGTAPLFAFSSQLTKATVTNFRHFWNFKEYITPQFQISAPLAAANTNGISQVTVDNVDWVFENQVYLVNGTNEQVLVVGLVGNTVTLRRGVGTTLPSATTAGTIFTSIGTAFEESSLRPLPVSGSYSQGENFTQIFRNTWAVSGTAKSIQTQIGDGLMASSKKDAMFYHLRDIETGLIFGEKFESVHKGQPFRKMGGMLQMIRTYAPENVVQAPRLTTYDDLEAMLDPMFNVATDHSSGNDRLIFTDSVGANALSKLGRMSGNIQINPGQNKFGYRFNEFSAGRGSFKVMEHPLFQHYPTTRGMMMVLDLSSFQVGYLPGRDTEYKDFNPNANSSSGTAQDNGIDATGGAFLTEMTALSLAPQANGIITGLCEVGCAPCVTVTNYKGWLKVDKPCSSGKVSPNTSVVVTLKSLANTEVKVATATGIETVTTDAQGNASFDYTVGTNEIYPFSILPDPNVDVTYTPAGASVCVDLTCITPAPAQEIC